MKVSKLKKVCNLIIVDSSSSMFNKQGDVKGGLMSLFSDIRKDTKAHQHTIVCTFDSQVKVLVNSVNINDIPDSIVEGYKTSGTTALYDAIGKSFGLVPAGYDGVFVNIITDGEENASKEFSADDIKKLMSVKNEEKWGITFMGTTKESILEAKNFGVKNTMMFQDSSIGLQTVNSSRSYSRSKYMESVYSGNVTVDNLID